MNYRCEDGRFQIPQAAWKSQPPADSLSSIERGVNPGIKSRKKKPYLNEVDNRKPLVASIL